MNFMDMNDIAKTIVENLTALPVLSALAGEIGGNYFYIKHIDANNFRGCGKYTELLRNMEYAHDAPDTDAAKEFCRNLDLITSAFMSTDMCGIKELIKNKDLISDSRAQYDLIKSLLVNSNNTLARKYLLVEFINNENAGIDDFEYVLCIACSKRVKMEKADVRIIFKRMLSVVDSVFKNRDDQDLTNVVKKTKNMFSLVENYVGCDAEIAKLRCIYGMDTISPDVEHVAKSINLNTIAVTKTLNENQSLTNEVKKTHTNTEILFQRILFIRNAYVQVVEEDKEMNFDFAIQYIKEIQDAFHQMALEKNGLINQNKKLDHENQKLREKNEKLTTKNTDLNKQNRWLKKRWFDLADLERKNTQLRFENNILKERLSIEKEH